MTRKPYPSNLKDAEWAVLEPLLPPHKPIGSRREVELREVVNALMYVADNGIKWRALSCYASKFNKWHYLCF